jgi:hypothetical protein
LYESQFPASELSRRGNIIVGNPSMSPEKTIGYEMGFDDQLSDIFEFDFTAFYKDVYGLTGIRTVPAVPSVYSEEYNVEYARMQGFEATMTKALFQYWSAKVDYTYSVSKGTASTPYDQYGVTHPVETDYYLDQDQRHNLSFELGLGFDRDFKVAVFREFDASLIGRYASGLPYSPVDLKGNPIGETNSARMPDNYSMDARIEKTVRIGKVGLNLTCDITNLLNTVLVTNVYPATGSPSSNGAQINLGQFSPIPIQLGDPGYAPARDLQHNGYITQQEMYTTYVAAYSALVNSPLNYGSSRRIRFGISMAF